MSLLTWGAAIGGGLVVDIARTVVLTVTAVMTCVLVGLVYRWYAGERVSDGLSLLVGLSVVAIYLNTAGALGEVIGGELELLAPEAVVFNTITFLVAGLAAVGGGRTGDRIGVGLFAIAGHETLDRDVNRIVRTVGRVTTVQLPDEIDDIDGYDAVGAATKGKLSGHVLVFPRRLTVDELRTRFVERLQTDYGVGHVDVDVADDGTIEYLALGGRESGIGPTLPPGSAAVAVRADPPNNASPGDSVQVWTGPPGPDADPETGASPQRVTNAEIRGTADDIVTLAVDESDAKRLDADRRYRLVTLPVEPRADRAFAAQLRTAAETMGVVSVGEDSVLVGNSVGALDVAVVAIEAVDGDIVAIPTRNREIGAGETLYVIARPDRMRKLEAAAVATPAGSGTDAGTGGDPESESESADATRG